MRIFTSLQLLFNSCLRSGIFLLEFLSFRMGVSPYGTYETMESTNFADTELTCADVHGFGFCFLNYFMPVIIMVLHPRRCIRL